MLVLTRRTGEHLKLGKDIYVTVVSIGRGNVRLGITAPQSMDVKRTEVPISELRRREANKRA